MRILRKLRKNRALVAKNFLTFLTFLIAKKHCPILRHICRKNPHGTPQIVIY